MKPKGEKPKLDRGRGEVSPFSEKERTSFLESFGRLAFDESAGLLIQGELVFHYQEIEDLVLGKGDEEKPISPYYTNKDLKSVLCRLGLSNLLVSPVWRKLELKSIMQGLDQEEVEIQTAFLELIAKKEFSGEIPPNEEDLEFFLESLREQGLIVGDYDLEKTKAAILKDWQKGLASDGYIARRLFKEGAEDVVFPGIELAIKEFPNDADWIYTFHVIKLVVMHRLVTEGLKKVNVRRFDVDRVYQPPFDIWPKFSEAYVRTGYISHEAIWTHELLRPEGEYKGYFPEV